jgi:hypothetical protein
MGKIIMALSRNNLKELIKMDNCKNEKIVPGILCDASHCVYHTTGDRCTAGEIQVGYKSSCSCSETACTTFEAKD